MDFYYNHSDKNAQIRLFEEHIKASIESKFPLVVHSRDAEDLTYEILSKSFRTLRRFSNFFTFSS